MHQHFNIISWLIFIQSFILFEWDTKSIYKKTDKTNAQQIIIIILLFFTLVVRIPVLKIIFAFSALTQLVLDSDRFMA